MILRISFFLVVLSTSLCAQSIKVEYDKNHDFTQYKTFTFGEGEIVTPKDERTIKDVTLHKWIKEAIAEEMKEKGLMQADSTSDLVVSYVIGALDRTDTEQLGPLGQSPGNNSQTWTRDYMQNSLIIDLNDRTKKMVWRINAVANAPATDAPRVIDQVVAEGFKKFSIKPKKEKKKKR